MNISNNISSIQAQQTMMDTTARNIANSNTDGFVPDDTKVVGGDNYVSTSTRKADGTGSAKSQTDLAKEIPNQIVAQRVTEANVSSIRTQDEMFGSLLDIKA